MADFVVTYDVGTTALKTCLFKVGKKIELVADESEGYALSIMENGGAEQNPEDWWEAMCTTTKKVLKKSGTKPEDIQGISFCAQMQGLVLVDREGNSVRPAMSYMDNRAGAQLKKTLKRGIKLDGLNITKLLKSVQITGVVASSVKDPVWKYNWVKENEPKNFARIYKWLDVKEYLIHKLTGEFIMTEDSAYATMLLDIRRNRRQFSPAVCKMLGVSMAHLPKIVKSTDRVGGVTAKAAKEMGLAENTSVFGGGGDASLIGIGAGAVKPGDTHIYIGTSGWVSTVTEKPLLDIDCKIAGIVGANEKTYNYFAELETAGKCIEWVKSHLAYEETLARMKQARIHGDYEDVAVDLYDYMMDAISDVPAGSHNVMFTPWLHGNRCPFEDTRARGMFFNIGIETKKSELIHAVIEGVCYHLGWQLECIRKKVVPGKKVRLAGGGALAEKTCQILSDIINLPVEVTHNPQNAGAMGAAVVSAVGLGLVPSIEAAGSMIAVERTYMPTASNQQTYSRGFTVFKHLYNNNKKSFGQLNA